MVIASVLFDAVVCWGGSTKKRDAGKLERLVRKAGSVEGAELECITSASHKRTRGKLLTVMDHDCHPLYNTVIKQKSLISWRLICPQGRTIVQSVNLMDKDLEHTYTVYIVFLLNQPLCTAPPSFYQQF